MICISLTSHESVMMEISFNENYRNIFIHFFFALLLEWINTDVVWYKHTSANVHLLCSAVSVGVSAILKDFKVLQLLIAPFLGGLQTLNLIHKNTYYVVLCWATFTFVGLLSVFQELLCHNKKQHSCACVLIYFTGFINLKQWRLTVLLGLQMSQSSLLY